MLLKMFCFVNFFLCHVKENKNKEEKTSCVLTCGHNLILCLKNKKQSSTFPETEKLRPQYLKEPMKREY